MSLVISFPMFYSVCCESFKCARVAFPDAHAENVMIIDFGMVNFVSAGNSFVAAMRRRYSSGAWFNAKFHANILCVWWSVSIGSVFDACMLSFMRLGAVCLGVLPMFSGGSVLSCRLLCGCCKLW